MKRFNLILCGVILIGICGCGNKQIETVKEGIDNYQEESIYKNNFPSLEWKCDIPLQDIIDFSEFDTKFITKDGDLFEFSYNQLFSNEKYCKKIDSNMKFTRFLNGAIETTANKIYGYSEGKFIEKLSAWTGAYDYNVYEKYPNSFLFSKVNDRSSYDINYQYAVVKNNIVYDINWDSLKLTEIDRLADDEEYIGSYYQILKTNKNFYNYNIINNEECKKYADIECKYGLSRIDEISDLYDEIYYFNGKKIIFKNDLNNIYFFDYTTPLGG